MGMLLSVIAMFAGIVSGGFLMSRIFEHDNLLAAFVLIPIALLCLLLCAVGMLSVFLGLLGEPGAFDSYG